MIKFLMSKFKSNPIIVRAVTAAALATMASSEVFAAGTNTQIGKIFKDPNFQIAITVGFGLLAFYKWIEYFSGFNVSSALKDIILPAVLTFLCFQWDQVLKWIGLM